MSVLHPVGPEPPQTYWVRRAVVLGAAILALIVLIAVVVSQNSSGTVLATPTPTPAAVPSTTITGPPPFTPTPSPSASSQASVTPTSDSPTQKSDPDAKSDSKDKSGNQAEKKEAGKSTASAKPTTTPKPAGPPSCPASQLRPTLTGDQHLKRKEKNTLSISLINGSGETCTLQVTKDNFELKIYSGKDRIWSSDDCSTAVKATKKTLVKEQALEWKMTWDGRRSKDDCEQRPEVPRAGTYFATAQYEGAEPVQLRMLIH